MEFRPTRHDRRNELKVPSRDGIHTPVEQPKPPKDLAEQRETLGFSDIPVDDENMDNVSFKDILRAWGKQSVKNSPLEKNLQKVSAKKTRLHKLKNDLKWAIQADLDEPVTPKPIVVKPPAQPKAQKPVDTDTSTAPSSKTIDININLGSLPKLPKIPKNRIPSVQNVVQRACSILFTKKALIACAVVVLLAGGAFAALPFIKQQTHKNTAHKGSSSTTSNETPAYTTVLPQNKSISDLGGWKRVSPETSDPVFAYADKINGTPINVSQQKVPESFKPDIDEQVAELAKGFSATDKIDANGTTVYVGTSTQGPQSAILVKNDLLILIKSTAKISDADWSEYAQSLN